MQRKLFLAGLVGLLVASIGVALAQTYSTFSYLRVLNILDVRTSIQNQDAAEDVVVDDDLTVTGALDVGSCTGCGGGTPGGSDTQVQYNDGGAFGGDSGLTFNETTNALTALGIIASTTGFDVSHSTAARLRLIDPDTSDTFYVANDNGVTYLQVPTQLDVYTGASARGRWTSTGLLAGLSGNGGSNPFKIVGADATGDAYGAWYENDNTTRKGYFGFGNGADNTLHYVNEESGAGITIATTGNGAIELTTGTAALTANSVSMTPQSGTFTISYVDACTTTQTQSARWYRMGDQVTITVSAAMPTCTGDTTLFQTNSGDIPAAARPSTSDVWSSIIQGNNNGTSTRANVELKTTGQIVINRCDTVTGTCDGGAWTNAGNRALDGWTVSFVR